MADTVTKVRNTTYPQVNPNRLMQIQQEFGLQVIGNTPNGAPIFNGVHLCFDQNKYRRCRKKIYQIYFCMPPVGTVLINKLEQADSALKMQQKYGKSNIRKHMSDCLCLLLPMSKIIKRQLNNDANLIDEYQAMYNDMSSLVNSGMAYKVTKGQVVLRGTLGEMWVTSLANLQRKYQVIQNNFPVQITPEILNQLCKECKGGGHRLD